MAEGGSFNEYALCDPEECRVVAIGRIGSGKSETGNSLLGKKAFSSHCSARAVTESCRCDSALRFGRRVVYIDTPGFFDIEKPKELIQQEIFKCIALSSPGPHAFLFITKVDRFTPEEKETIDLCEQLFGKEFYKHLVVVFTHKTKLDKDEKSLQQFIAEAPSALQDIFKRNENVCIAIENESSPDKKEEQMNKLFSLITNIVEKNEGKHFTNTAYVQMEEKLLKEEDTKRRSRAEQLAESIRQKKKSIKINRRNAKDEMQLLMGLISSLEISQDEGAVEEAGAIQTKINQSDADYQLLKQDLRRLRHELQRIDKESRECPKKPGLFRLDIRKMIEAKEGQVVFKFLKDYGPVILKTLLPFFLRLLTR
ncbi:hypothetical protein CHS0354_029610 [Potamilus streckersoni]|uniref:AIG1-type G domain-containing protein n=1 Tax=Potamilus streckersoni TaxID=2493646 RepID=A0AAE0RTI4_9BIVA|nr:hypothetical protein CHS0354_029610 [Potamilus streckersoni]